MIDLHRALLLLLAAALLASGCGEAERVEYERDLARIGTGVDAALAALPQDESRALGPADVARLADEVREAAEQLSDLEPPDDARAAQRRLERGLRGVAAAFEELAKKLEGASDDAEKADVFVDFATDPKVDAAFDDIIGAQERYAAEGYRVFGARGRGPAGQRASTTPAIPPRMAPGTPSSIAPRTAPATG